MPPRRADAWSGAAENGDDAVRGFLSRQQGTVALVAHRVVHGGECSHPAPVDAAVEAEIERLARYAPLHNPVALRWIRRFSALLPGVPQLAVFDTAFFADLPEVSSTYALPAELLRGGVRRFGFHGLAHRSMWEQWRSAAPAAGGRVISLQLGAGCSIAAVRDARAVDTSMGFSPLEGLVMATRPGDVDPGLIFHLQREAGIDLPQLEEIFNRRSGLLGLSGLSGDMRELLAADTAAARLAVDVFCYRARKYVGAYLAALGGADAILFGGGIGENAPPVRERILEGLHWAGIAFDRNRNAAAAGPGTPVLIGGPNADGLSTAVWVIPVDEALVLAEEGWRALEGKGTEHA